MNHRLRTASLLAAASLLLSADAIGAKLKVPSQYGTIQAAVDAAVAFDIIEIAAGTYVENVDIELKNDLKIVGDGKVVVDGAGAGDIFFVGNSDAIRIENLVLKNAARAVHTLSSSKVIVEDVVAKHTTLTALWFDQGANCRVIDSSVMDAGAHGIAFTSSIGCHVEETKIELTGSSGILLSGSQHTIADCEIVDAGHYGLRFGEGGNAAIGVLVTGSEIENPTYDGALLTDDSADCSFLGNVFKGGDEGVTVVQGSEGHLIDDNSFRQMTGNGLELDAMFLTISRNRIKKAGANGVFVKNDADWGLYHQNKVKKAGFNGIYVGGTGNSFHQNKAKGSGGHDLDDTTAPGQNVYSGNSFGTTD